MINYRIAQDNIMEILVSGKITRDDIDATWIKIKEDMPAHGKIRLLEIIGDLKGIEPAALWQDLKLGLPMLDRVERVAVVSDRGWIAALSKVSNMLTPAEVRTFEPSEIEDARAWLTSP